MTETVSTTVDADISIDRVWAVLSDYFALADWASAAWSITSSSDGPIATALAMAMPNCAASSRLEKVK